MLSYPQQVRRKYYPVNENIRDKELRVISSEGKNLGLMRREEALEAARKERLDLVVISTKAAPPVAKILDFRKFFYQQRKGQTNQKKKDKLKEPKTLRVGPHIDENDLKTRIERARDFLEEDHPVRFEMLFKGRTIAHPKLGIEKLEKIKAVLSKEARVERDIERRGRMITMVLGPE